MNIENTKIILKWGSKNNVNYEYFYKITFSVYSEII